MPEKNFTFEIVQHLGVITKFDSGWNRELNIISWNGNGPKYDIRDWDPHHERMKKGITLREAELRKVVDLFLHNNSQKAVELGRALDEERRARRQAQFAEAVGAAGATEAGAAAEDAEAAEAETATLAAEAAEEKAALEEADTQPPWDDDADQGATQCQCEEDCQAAEQIEMQGETATGSETEDQVEAQAEPQGEMPANEEAEAGVELEPNEETPF